MTTGMGPVSGPQPRRPFAAKYHYRRPGVVLGIIGLLLLIGGLTNVEMSGGERVSGVIVGLLVAALAVYLLRGQGESPGAAAQRVAAERFQAATVASSVDHAKAALVAAGSGGAAVVAYRNLEVTVQRFHPQDAQGQLGQALAAINFDRSILASPSLGVIPALPAGTTVEVFRDWVIYGQEAHDVDASTGGDVFVDWSMHVPPSRAAKGKKKGKNEPVQINQHPVPVQIARLQFASSDWSMSVPIPPQQVNEARRVVGQLEAHVATLQPKGVTAADIQAMVGTILSNTGQPPAEKLKQLSNLRYDRLLSDEEFERAKSKILGIG